MKYKETLQAQSVPQWALYNIEYDKLKNLIKVHTTDVQGQTIAIPEQGGVASKNFEELFFNELSDQHNCADLFVKSKADEIRRRLQWTQKAILRLVERCANNYGPQISPKRLARFAKYDRLVRRCGDDLKSLSNFVDAQCMTFHKILKNQRKWTGSQTLGARFNDEVLGNPKSFVKCDFGPLMSQYDEILTALRASTPASSESATPKIRSRQPSVQTPVQEVRQSNWNEYDYGSEAESEPYTIYVYTDAESTYPGARIVASLISMAKGLTEKFSGFFISITPQDERRCQLIRDSYLTEQTGNIETDIEDNNTSPSDPARDSATPYATFPSTIYQEIRSQDDESILFKGTICSFVAASVFLLSAGILLFTGRRGLRTEVDAGVTVAIVASLFFATLGFGCMLHHKERLGWLHRICVGITFVAVCVLNGILLVLVAGNAGL